MTFFTCTGKTEARGGLTTEIEFKRSFEFDIRVIVTLLPS